MPAFHNGILGTKDPKIQEDQPTKYAARLTQRKEATFNYQTAKRMTEFMVLDFGMHEVDGGKVVWEYFEA